MTVPLLALVFGPSDDPGSEGAPGYRVRRTETLQGHAEASASSATEIDRTLIDQLRSNNAAAVDTIVTLYYTSLVGFAAHILGDVETAEDVVQDALIAVWDRRATFVVRTTLGAYLFTAVRNTALNARRNLLARIRRNEAQAADVVEPFGQMPSADVVLERDEREQILRAAVAELSPRYREVILLRAGGLTYDAIGEVLELPAKTVQSRGLRGIAMLRAALEGKI